MTLIDGNLLDSNVLYSTRQVVRSAGLGLGIGIYGRVRISKVRINRVSRVRVRVRVRFRALGRHPHYLACIFMRLVYGAALVGGHEQNLWGTGTKLQDTINTCPSAPVHPAPSMQCECTCMHEARRVWSESLAAPQARCGVIFRSKGKTRTGPAILIV